MCPVNSPSALVQALADLMMSIWALLLLPQMVPMVRGKGHLHSALLRLLYLPCHHFPWLHFWVKSWTWLSDCTTNEYLGQLKVLFCSVTTSSCEPLLWLQWQQKSSINASHHAMVSKNLDLKLFMCKQKALPFLKVAGWFLLFPPSCCSPLPQCCKLTLSTALGSVFYEPGWGWRFRVNYVFSFQTVKQWFGTACLLFILFLPL